ncbi:MAG: GNAT family N-acetyltransferase [Ignavibacteriales bacterium]|nr:MAG: GNAT family N-acetyltransferase [Ignavibacteriales bacterium]
MVFDYKKLSDTELSSAEWDEFVEKSDNGTIFHTRKFLSYHPEGRFEDTSLLFFKDGKPLSLLPAVAINRNGKRVLSSHSGASYGGFVYKSSFNLKEAFTVVEQTLEFAKNNGFDAIQLTLPPIIYASSYSNYLDFALFRNGFSYLKREVSSVVELSGGRESILASYRPEARTALKKAQSLGVEIAETERFDEYYEILKKNLRMRHNVNPTHTLEELKRLKQMYPAKIRLWGAFKDETLLAGVCNFSANNNVVLAFYISHDEEYQMYRPVNLLFYEIMNRSRDEGFKFLDFGIFTVNMEPNWGLGRFKENFGARGIFRDTFYIEL